VRGMQNTDGGEKYPSPSHRIHV